MMKSSSSQATPLTASRRSFWLLLACMAVVLAWLFRLSFSPGHALFANDGPYGVQMAHYLRMPGAFLGIWNDLFWLGAYNGNLSPNFTGLLLWGLGPRIFVNFYTPLTCVIAGVCAWLFFRTLGFRGTACALGGMAAALNGNFFSNACWGLGTRGLALAAIFLSLAAVQSSLKGNALLKFILAGLAIGLSISEGADNGAIFSVFVAAYVFFLAVTEEGPLATRVFKGGGRVALMAACAGLIALQSLYVFSKVAGKSGGQVETNPVLLSAEEIPDASALTERLQQGSNALVAAVWTRFSPESKQVLTNTQAPASVRKARLVEELNAVLKGPSLDDPQRLTGVTLTEETRQLMARHPQGEAHVRLNRLLLEDALPGAWMKLQAKEEAIRAQSWDWATQWSLPKAESLRVIIPGLFGYRLDTRGGGNYWGAVGRQSGWEEHHQGFARHSGAGEYAGVLVGLMAVWALANSLSRTGSAFSVLERRAIWFWSIAALVALLLSWGRYAPFYRLIYLLPYFSTIRNPMKFMHPFHMTLMILFAYGLTGISRRYLEKAANGLAGRRSAGPATPVPSSAGVFEKRWLLGSIAAFALGLLGHFIYSGSQQSLARYLTTVGFEHPVFAAMIAAFSVHEVGIFLLFLAVSLVAVVAIQRGWFVGNRARWAGVGLGIILVVDLARADTPWIYYFDLEEKYASNPVLDVLRDKPYLHRVTGPNFPVGGQAGQAMAQFQQVYTIEWVQHHFQLFNIQALEVAQMPRGQGDYVAFNKAIAPTPARLWELTNTRYILGLAGFDEAFNAQLDAQKKRFRNVLLYELRNHPDGSPDPNAITNTAGPFALIEFTGALPRAKLYAQWQVMTNDAAALQLLADPAFDPAQTVIVAEPIPPAPAAGANLPEVQHVRYTPRRLELRANSSVPAVLLLNDRYDPNWKVLLDGKPAPLLRCNFVMRGVQVPPGEHTITFYFAPQNTGFWVMSACVGLGLVLTALLVVVETRQRREATREPPRPQG